MDMDISCYSPKMLFFTVAANANAEPILQAVHMGNWLTYSLSLSLSLSLHDLLAGYRDLPQEEVPAWQIRLGVLRRLELLDSPGIDLRARESSWG